MNRFEDLEAFVAVVDTGGFGLASEKLGIAKSMVSRRVSDLETRLGVQLLKRTTRKQSLTQAGQEFFPRASQILADWIEAEEFISNADCEISGNIRLALPLVIGVTELARPIGRFLLEHPGINLDIDLNDRSVDLIQDDFDLAIRIGEMKDSNLVARRLGDFHFAICASPDYLAKNGEPAHPDELTKHEVLVYSNVSPGRQWSYQLDGKRINPRVKFRLRANNGAFLAVAACDGLAIVSGPLAYLQAHIDSGELVQILTGFTPASTGIYAVYPPVRRVSRRVKSLSDALFQHYRKHP